MGSCCCSSLVEKRGNNNRKEQRLPSKRFSSVLQGLIKIVENRSRRSNCDDGDKYYYLNQYEANSKKERELELERRKKNSHKKSVRIEGDDKDEDGGGGGLKENDNKVLNKAVKEREKHKLSESRISSRNGYTINRRRESKRSSDDRASSRRRHHHHHHYGGEIRDDILCCSILKAPEWCDDECDSNHNESMMIKLGTYIICTDKDCHWKDDEEIGMSCERRIARMMVNKALPLNGTSSSNKINDMGSTGGIGMRKHMSASMKVHQSAAGNKDQHYCCSTILIPINNNNNTSETHNETFILCDNHHHHSSQISDKECDSIQRIIANLMAKQCIKRSSAAAALHIMSPSPVGEVMKNDLIDVEDKGKEEELTRLLSLREVLEAQLVRANKRIKLGRKEDDGILNNNGVNFNELLLESRKLTPTTIPPPYMTFTCDAGPQEALPVRSHVPFPTLDEFRTSTLFMHIIKQQQQEQEQQQQQEQNKKEVIVEQKRKAQEKTRHQEQLTTTVISDTDRPPQHVLPNHGPSALLQASRMAAAAAAVDDDDSSSSSSSSSDDESASSFDDSSLMDDENKIKEDIKTTQQQQQPPIPSDDDDDDDDEYAGEFDD